MSRTFLKSAIDPKLLRGITVGMGSKIIGYVRDFLVPNLLGVGVTADLFILLTRITLYVRSSFGDNLWISLFVPRLAHRETGSKDRSEAELRLWLAVFRGFFFVEIIFLPVRGGLLLDAYFWHFFFSSENAYQVALFVTASFSLTPLVLGCALLALLHGRSQVLTANAIAGWSNIVFVFFLLGSVLFAHEGAKLFWLALSFIGAAAAQFIAAQRFLQVDLAWRRILNVPHFASQNARRILQILVVATGLSLQSMPSLMVSIAAVHEEGAVTILYLGQRLVTLFPTLVALPMAALMFPELSKLLKQSDIGNARRYVDSGLLQGFALSLLGAALTAVAIWPVSYLMFSRDVDAARQFSIFRSVVLHLLPTIPLIFILQILQRFFRARRSDWAVLIAGILGCVVTAAMIAVSFLWGSVTIDELATALVGGSGTMVLFLLALYVSQARGGKKQ